MLKTTIRLKTIGDVKKFAAITNKYTFKISLSSEQYKIDGKSIMGVFSLDLSKPLLLEAETEDFASFLEEIRPFCV